MKMRTLLLALIPSLLAGPSAAQMDPSDCVQAEFANLPTGAAPDYSFTFRNVCEDPVVLRWYQRKGNDGGDEWSERQAALGTSGAATYRVQGRLLKVRSNAFGEYSLPSRLVVYCAAHPDMPPDPMNPLDQRPPIDRRCSSGLGSRFLLGDLSRTSYRVGGS